MEARVPARLICVSEAEARTSNRSWTASTAVCASPSINERGRGSSLRVLADEEGSAEGPYSRPGGLVLLVLSIVLSCLRGLLSIDLPYRLYTAVMSIGVLFPFPFGLWPYTRVSEGC